MVKDISPGSASASPSELVEVGGALLFTVYNYSLGKNELWKSDGTEEGTAVLSAGFSYPYSLRKAGSTLYFTATDDLRGRELWKTDGTAAGTVLVGG